MSVRQATMETLMRLVESVVPASAVTTSTWWTQDLVMHAQASASNVCTTQRARAAATASWVIMVMPLHKTADVSTRIFLHLSNLGKFILAICFISSPQWVIVCCSSGCVCNHMGTRQDTCPSVSECHCDQNNGQCQCLPNVVGQHCDLCAPDTWNMASGRGCEACDCDPNHSSSSACNEVMSLSYNI